MKKIQVGVRDFALPIPRTGSIEVNSGYGSLPLKGREIHAVVQSMRKQEHGNYQSEVRLSHSFDREEFTFVVSGQIDGLIESSGNGTAVIEEIKTAFDVGDLYNRLAAQPDHPYCLQLKTYLYLYERQHAQNAQGRLVLVSSRNARSMELELPFWSEEYELWLEKRLNELVVETRIKLEDETRRKQIARLVRFPFDQPRKSQLELIDYVDENLKHTDPLLIQAPTGLGKTAGIMYPALKEAFSRGQKLIYITPKNSQHKGAEAVVKKLQKQSRKLRSLTITAKSKVCLKEETICNPQYCEYARDYYAKVYSDKLLDKLTRQNHLSAAIFKEYGLRHEVCPFELSVDALARADIVIGDYNYVYSPRSLLGRLTQPGAPKSSRPNLVIDEAHNLPSRATDYYSASLSTYALDQIKARLSSTPQPFQFQALILIDRLKSLIYTLAESNQRECVRGEARITISSEAFASYEESAGTLLRAYLEGDLQIGSNDPILQLCNALSEFVQATAFEGDNFFTTVKSSHTGATIKVCCTDASEKLKQAHEAFAHTIGFSATMKPFAYYAQLSGFDVEKTKTIEFQSPFPRDNRKLLIIPQVSTRFSDRRRFYPKIAEAIKRITETRRGNYFVFFPSFEFLDQVFDLFSGRAGQLSSFTLLKQKREMKTGEVNEYIERLLAREQPTIVFAVQGGVFSEGVDYPGESVIGAIIVGPALPNYSLERELLKEYYEKSYGSGYDYAYTYPAMTKVIQSAGRVIRSETDNGLIVLMDRRFIEPSYVNVMPGDWFDSSVRELVSDKILADINQFWSARVK